MNSKPISFQQLPFSDIFRDYTADFSKLDNFFSQDPFATDVWSLRIKNVVYRKNRTELREVLQAFNPHDSTHPNALRNIERLTQSEQAYTVVTGQQLSIAGGPLFTMFKILSAVHAARQAESVLQVPVIPIFWLADEDHDFEEISRLRYPGNPDWTSVELSKPTPAGQPVSLVNVDSTWQETLRKISEALIPNEFREEVMALLNKAYLPGSTHGEAFSRLISHVFSPLGVVIAGSFQKKSRLMLRDDIISLLRDTELLHNALETQSEALDTVYHRQASVNLSNWFYINNDKQREKLTYSDGNWSSASCAPVSTEGLIRLFEANPLCLSPNVFLRPLLQDKLLPNLCYVAGPGEIAYYAQMKRLYAAAGLSMPVIVPRLSATIIDTGTARHLEELPFVLHEYNQRIEDIEKQYLDREAIFDIQAFSDQWITELESLADQRVRQVEALDATLAATLAKAKQDQINTVHQLRQKMLRSQKNKHEVQLKRLMKVQQTVFPGRELQERVMPFIYLINKFGPSVVERLLHETSTLSLRQHHLIYL